MNKVNKFINACNIKEDFSPSMFNNLDILVSDTKDSEKTLFFDLEEDVRFFQLDPNNDTEFNKCGKNVTTVALDYSVVPSVKDIETLKQEIDKDTTKSFWLAVTFNEVVELKKVEKVHTKTKHLKGLSKLADEKEKAMESDAMDKAKKIFDAKLIIETKQYRDEIKKLKRDLEAAQKTSTDLRLQVANKDNQIKTLTNQLKDAKKNTYTESQYNNLKKASDEYKKSHSYTNTKYTGYRDGFYKLSKKSSYGLRPQHHHLSTDYYQLFTAVNFTGAIRFNKYSGFI